jgi:hypothetical protein
MELDIALLREAQQTRVVVRGQASLGQLCSLLRVLEVDCATWPPGEVRLDLGQLHASLDPAEQAMLQEVAACRLRSKRVAILWPRGA